MRHPVGTETGQPAGPPAVLSVPETLKKYVAFLTRDTFLLLLLAVTFVSGVFWAAVIPLWQIPDEPAHFGYIQSLGEDFSILADAPLSQEITVVYVLTGLGAVPFHRDVTQPFAAGSQQGPQEGTVKELPDSLRVQNNTTQWNPAISYPSGYYLPASLVYRLLGSQDVLTIMFGLRIFSAFLTTLTMLFGYLTLKRFFHDEAPAKAKATALIIAFSPMYIYMGMAVNVDVLVWLFFSVYLYLLTKALTEGLSPRLNLLVALTAALGLWVKQTFLLAIPFYLILLVFLNLSKSLTPSRTVVPLLAFFATIAILDGWLYLGDFIRTSPTYAGGTETEEASIMGFFRHLVDRWPMYRWTFDTFWGNFGWLDTPLSQRSYDFLRWGSAAAATGLVLYFITSILRRRVDVLSLFYLSLSITFIAFFILVNYIRITTGEGWLLQGRYFFPIIVPIIALQVRGLTWFVNMRPFRDIALLALVVGIILFQVDVLFRYVIPRYYL